MATITTIDATDLISDSRSDINTNFANLNSDKIETSVIDTDTTLAANSDAKLPSQKAVKAYVDTLGNVNASETTRGIVEEATTAQVTAGDSTGETGAKLFVTPAKLAARLDTQRIDVYDVSGSPHTWNKPTGAKFIKVMLIGGGGGGGVADDTSGTGGGGGGGEYKEFIFDADDIGSSETVTIGAGGAVETNGGNTSFGSHLSAQGGRAATGSDTSGAAGGNGGSSTTIQYIYGINSATEALRSGSLSGAGGQGGTNGGNSVYGGAGGGGGNNVAAANQAGSAGTSVLAGNGGAGSGSGAASAGSVPGGGGGGTGSSAGSAAAGGAGRATIISFL